MSVYSDWTSTPIFNKPALRYPAVAGFNAFEVPMIITDYKPVTRNPKTTTYTSVPAVEAISNLAYQGFGLGIGSLELPKIQLQGTIDTPIKNDGQGNMLPQIRRDKYYLHYADLITMCLEGRYIQGNTWQRVEPTYFRDPFGRVFSNCQVINFTATYVEGTPGRTQFTMTLRV